MNAALRAVTYHLPEAREANRELACLHPARSVEEIFAKTGVLERAISADTETASDLGEAAAGKLFARQDVDRNDVDFLLFCTSSPDYFVPTSACILQNRLQLRKDIGALDINLGCSGYVYSMSVAKALVETGQARTVLLVTAETYSKYCAKDDRVTRLLFGDGASATLVEAAPATHDGLADIGPFVFGTDGAGAEFLMVRNGASREAAELPGRQGGPGVKAVTMRMDGQKMFSFATAAVPLAVRSLLERAQIAMEDIDAFVFHQASAYILQRIAHELQIPYRKLLISMEDCGNTGASSIPIVLGRAVASGSIKPGMRVAIVGFGTGLSWAATLIRWG